MKIHLFFIIFVFFYLFKSTVAFESDELITNDEEFEGVVVNRILSPPPPPTIRHHRKPDLDSSSSSSSDSKAIQFDLEHAFGDFNFSPTGTFTARLKSWTHGGQTLTKLRFPRNELTGAEREAERLLREDDFYTIRVPCNVLNSAGKEYVVSSIRVPTKWFFNSYTVLKTSEQARRTPTFAEEMIQTETAEGEGVKPPEKSFWAKYVRELCSLMFSY